MNIDWEKPLQLADGRKATVVQKNIQTDGPERRGFKHLVVAPSLRTPGAFDALLVDSLGCASTVGQGRRDYLTYVTNQPEKPRMMEGYLNIFLHEDPNQDVIGFWHTRREADDAWGSDSRDALLFLTLTRNQDQAWSASVSLLPNEKRNSKESKA